MQVSVQPGEVAGDEGRIVEINLLPLRLHLPVQVNGPAQGGQVQAAGGTAFLGREDDDLAFVPCASPLAVAAPGGLYDPVQRPDSAEDAREVQVNPAFDEARTDKECRQGAFEPFAYLGQHGPAMVAAHQRGEVENIPITSVRVQNVQDLAGLAAGIQDAQARRSLSHFRSHPLPIPLVRLDAVADAPEKAEVPVPVGLRNDRLHRREAIQERRHLARQSRLGRGTEHDRDAEVGCQRLQSVYQRRQQVGRQGLHLVQHDHGLCQPVQLPAGTGAIGEEAFKELYSRGHDQRRIPVLRREPPPQLGLVAPVGFLSFSFERLRLDGGMVFQDGARRVAEQVTEDLGGLIHDAGVGDGVDDAPQAVLCGVFQREGQPGACFAAPGWDGQVEDSGREVGRRQAGVIDLPPHPVDDGRLRAGEVTFLPVAQ